MTVDTRTVGALGVLDLEGRLTLGEGDLVLREAVRGLLEKGHNKLVLNLRGIAYMDSAGLGEILACKRQALEHGGDLKLVTPPRKIRDVLTMSRVTDVVGIFDDESAAVGSF